MRKDDLQRQLDAFISAKAAACEAMSDEQALDCVALYPTLRHDGSHVKAGARIRHNGVLMRASVDLWDRLENDPDHAPALWEEVKIDGGIREIPANMQTVDAFSKGEKGRWNGHIYESKIDNNIWTPDQYSAGWELVS